MQPQRQSNPWLIVLGVCGGCALLGIIAVVVLGAIGINKSKDLIKGAQAMEVNMPKFLTDLKSKDYASAAALVDPSAQDKLSADKIQALEESVEKQLGALKSYPPKPTNTESTTIPDPSGKPTAGAEWKFSYKLTYEKGTATATFAFKTTDVFHPSGLVTDFKIQPDNGG
ncbi:MAG TPA: DUF3887 domain-containing protein [Chthonomonadaceae bacterium]|nr:DUF3887 domain-containing protein [Chthonomonadaceae bacterium]